MIYLRENKKTLGNAEYPIKRIGGHGLGATWWPMGRERRVLIDPHFSFGRPIISDSGVPTDVLAATYEVTEDVEWFAKLPPGERNVIITLDRNISRNPAKRQAWKESGAIVFFLKRRFIQQKPWDQIAKMVKKWPQICKLASRAKPGDGFVVHGTGDKIEPFEL